MNSSPWLAGASTIGRQSGPPRSSARACHAGPVGGPLLSVPVLTSRRPSKGVDTVAPARCWMGDFRKAALPAPRPPPPPRGPALADLCPSTCPWPCAQPGAAAGCWLGRGPGLPSLPLRACAAVLVTVDGALGL